MTDVIDLGRTSRAKATAEFRRSFFPAELKRPHPIRRMAIIKAHPEVKALMGQDRWTAAICLGILVGQIGMAALLGHLGLGYWWVALIAAWCIGAFPNHAMFVIIHDATHNLVFKNVVLNKLLLIVADLPNTVPTGMGFRCYHVKHHSHLGDYDFDADLPSRWEADLVGNKWYMKAGWLFFFALFQLTRLERLKGTVPMKNRWTIYNGAAIFAFDARDRLVLRPQRPALPVRLVLVLGRPASAGRALDPGAFHARSRAGDVRLLRAAQHRGAEHRLPQRAPRFPGHPVAAAAAAAEIAPEFYDTLKTHKSWTRLFITFIVDRRYTLYSRVDRSPSTIGAAPLMTCGPPPAVRLDRLSFAVATWNINSVRLRIGLVEAFAGTRMRRTCCACRRPSAATPSFRSRRSGASATARRDQRPEGLSRRAITASHRLPAAVHADRAKGLLRQGRRAPHRGRAGTERPRDRAA